MKDESASYDLVRFGVFEADLRAGELRKQGVKIKLQDLPFRTLAILLEHSGKVVSREELQERLWPDEIYVDFDNSLNAAVKKLREALSDSADSPRFIETLPRRGYRFIAPIESIEPTNSKPRSTSNKAADDLVRRPYPMAVSLALVVILLLAGSVYFIRNRNASSAPAPSEKIKLVVLPFEAIGPNLDNEYFNDGLTEEVITQLARLEPSRLGVIARNSSMPYKGRNRSIEQIGRELDVDYVLEGSVRRDRHRVRITAQLIKVSDSTHLWAETFERDLSDMFLIQSEIANLVSRSLQITLLPSQLTPLNGASTGYASAQEAYWKGRFYWNTTTREGLLKSIEYFEEALKIDSNFALAQASLADTYNYLGIYRFMPPDEAFPKARAAADRALQINEALGAGHAALSLTLVNYYWNWQEAGREIERAMVLDPGRAIVHHWAAAYYAITERHGEALAAAKKAQELDPLSLNVNSDLGWYYYYARRYDDAISQCRRTLELNPNAPGIRFCIELSLRQKGLEQEEFDSIKAELSQANAPPKVIELLDKVYSQGGTKAVLKWIVENQEKRAAAGGSVSTYLLAANNASLQDRERAFHWLEQAFANRESWVAYIGVDPAFDGLRSNPRFANLIQRIGLK